MTSAYHDVMVTTSKVSNDVGVTYKDVVIADLFNQIKVFYLRI